MIAKNTEDAFVLDTQKHPFELTYKDQHTEIVTTSMQIENQRQKAKVSLVKEFEALCNQTYSPLFSVVCGVYAKEDILTANGEIGIEKGSLVHVFAVDEMGNGVINTDIPAGSYFVKELATGDGYALSDKEYPFEFKHISTEVDTTLSISTTQSISKTYLLENTPCPRWKMIRQLAISHQTTRP